MTPTSASRSDRRRGIVQRSDFGVQRANAVLDVIQKRLIGWSDFTRGVLQGRDLVFQPLNVGHNAVNAGVNLGQMRVNGVRVIGNLAHDDFSLGVKLIEDMQNLFKFCGVVDVKINSHGLNAPPVGSRCNAVVNRKFHTGHGQ